MRMRSVWVQEFLYTRSQELTYALAQTNTPEGRSPLLERLLVIDALTVCVGRHNMDARTFAEFLVSVKNGTTLLPHTGGPVPEEEAAELLRRWPQWIECVA
jgi:hypothetical protein